MGDLKILYTGYIDCESKTCRFRYDCANHETAGLYRYETGKSPQIILFDDSTVECSSQYDGKFHGEGAVERYGKGIRKAETFQ